MEPGFLSRERIVAPPGHDRWLVPPAALAIHLSIGQAYAFSVFNLPLSRAIGVTAPAPGDWKLTTIGWAFTLAIVVLGLSAAFGGRWVERAGPRKSGVIAAACWGSGFLVAALGVRLHAIALVYLGYGVLGGTGLGLGYITPVSTLIKWFPDRRGMATGMAIMGFGGGAMIAAPLSETLMRAFATPTSVGVAETFVVLGLVYGAAMAAGALLIRVPDPDASGLRVVDPGGAQAGSGRAALVTTAHVSPGQAIRTPQFYLLWAVLFLNVTAGLALGVELALRHVAASVDGPHGRVAAEPQHEQARHDDHGDVVRLGGPGAAVDLVLADVVDEDRAGDAGGRPRSEQAAVDGADVGRAEEVGEVRRDGREAPAVHRHDRRDARDEERDAARPARDRHRGVEERAQREEERVRPPPPDAVGERRPEEAAPHVEEAEQADEPRRRRRLDRAVEHLLDHRRRLPEDADALRRRAA
jgi:MFS family permease